jgi:hypothetical protein
MEGVVENGVIPQAIVISERQVGDVTEGAESKGGFASHFLPTIYLAARAAPR